MSESDDTDVLLLIPPDLFVVPSSDSEDSYYCAQRVKQGSGVVSEILEHVQSLETRISAIESKDNSLEVSLLNASLDSQLQTHSYPLAGFSSSRQQQAKFSLSQLSSLPCTPAKPRHCLSVKSSPSGHGQLSCVTNTNGREMRLGRHASRAENTNTINANSRAWKKHDDLTSHSESSKGGTTHYGSSLLARDKHGRNSLVRSTSTNCESTGLWQNDKRDIKEMELSEVNELLQEMEATEVELAKRINSSNSHRYSEGKTRLTNVSQDPGSSYRRETKPAAKLLSPMRRLDFQFVDETAHGGGFDSLNFRGEKIGQPFADVSLPDDDAEFPLDDTDKMISSFKTWEPRGSTQHADKRSRNVEELVTVDKSSSVTESGESTDRNYERLTINNKSTNRQILNNDSSSKFGENRISRSSEISDVEAQIPNAKTSNFRSLPNIQNSTLAGALSNDCAKSHGLEHGDCKTDDTVDSGWQATRQLTDEYTNDLQHTVRQIRTMGQHRTNSPVARNSETYPRKSQRLLTLSDFWDSDGTKSQEEMLRIRLEEEKFRREHCEHLIQELQKRLLEQQEKVAVAIRVDNEKNAAIAQFQSAWSKLKQRWVSLEKDHAELESTLKNLTESHNSEITDYQQQIKRGEGELSKALDLAAGYKEKSDALVKEKLDLLKSHADELEKYKCLVQEAEHRYENLKSDYGKLLERNKQLEEIGNNAQQELNKERLRSAEVRTEMGVIHKALDACEAELTILRQEKESLQLKVKEELARNGILEQNKAAMLAAINDAKNAEQIAKDETKSLIDRQEQIRAELREVYQNQVEDVVKTKLKEFQEQLDAAETAFQVELDAKQRAIAECAARKIKSIIDKHQLEINLLEQKHMEEKRLGELQLAQVAQKTAMLEGQLSTQRATKTHLAEQLHSVMQKQWQQALQIISGGNMENLSPIQRLNAERLFESKKSKRCHSACCNREIHPAKPTETPRTSSVQNLQNSNSRHEQDESLVTLTSNDETPLVTRKESKDDLRKYIQMILDMQQPKDNFGRSNYIRQSSESPPPTIREVPRKHYVKKEQNGFSEESITWQNAEEPSAQDTSEYLPIAQSQATKNDQQQRSKPPWK